MLDQYRASIDTDDQFDITFVDHVERYYEFSRNTLRPLHTCSLSYKLNLQIRNVIINKIIHICINIVTYEINGEMQVVQENINIETF